MAWPNNVTQKDLRIEAFVGSGKGGQHKQKTSSAIRITHIKTGISAVSQDSRFQAQNKKLAFRRLADKLVPLMLEQIQKQRFELQVEKQETVRHYRETDRIVKDKRLPKTFDYYEVLTGTGLEDIIDELVRSGL